MAKNEFVCEGLDELAQYFKNFADSPEFQKLSKQAVKAGADIIAEGIKSNIENTKDKGYSEGYTAEEIVVGAPRPTKDGFVSKIGWRGPHKRYALVHLNEFGYSKGGKTYHQPLFGKVENAIQTNQKKAVETISNMIKEGVKQID